MIVREVPVSGEESARKAIRGNLEKQVILNDEHFGWCHGLILPSGHDEEVYSVKMGSARGVTQLHYHDLKQLLLLENHPHYLLPEIK